MSTIRNTIEQTLTSAGYSSYLRYAEPVIEALNEREDAIKDGLMDAAHDRGLSTDEVDTIFVEVGLAEPTPEPTETAEGNADASMADVLAAVQDLRTQIDALKSAAARHGVRV